MQCMSWRQVHCATKIIIVIFVCIHQSMQTVKRCTRIPRHLSTLMLQFNSTEVIDESSFTHLNRSGLYYNDSFSNFRYLYDLNGKNSGPLVANNKECSKGTITNSVVQFCLDKLPLAKGPSSSCRSNRKSQNDT